MFFFNLFRHWWISVLIGVILFILGLILINKAVWIIGLVFMGIGFILLIGWIWFINNLVI